MNIKQLAAEKSTDDTPVDLIVRDRAGEVYTANGQPVVWQIVGEYSSQYRANERQITDRVLKAARRGEDFDGEDSEDVTLERLAGGVVGWVGMEDEGKVIPCNVRNVVAVLKAAPWIVPQVSRIVKGHSGFFGKSSPASSES